MAMSKQDFVALADMIREHNTNIENENSYPGGQLFDSKQIETLAEFCKQQNRAFMRERWLGYIAGENGKNGGKVAK